MLALRSEIPGTDRAWPRRLLIFASFLCGALLYGQLGEKLPAVSRDFFQSTYAFLLPLAAGLILSASLLGPLLLPICALALGLVSGFSAGEIREGWFAGAGLDGRLIWLNLISVPAFFAIAVKGLKISSMLYSAMERQGLRGKSEFSGEYIPMIITVIVAVLACCLI